MLPDVWTKEGVLSRGWGGWTADPTAWESSESFLSMCTYHYVLNVPRLDDNDHINHVYTCHVYYALDNGRCSLGVTVTF